MIVDSKSSIGVLSKGSHMYSSIEVLGRQVYRTDIAHNLSFRSSSGGKTWEPESCDLLYNIPGIKSRDVLCKSLTFY